MSKNRQLYKQNSFNLPKIDQIQYTPFKTVKNDENSSSNLVNILNDSIAEIKPTYSLAYNSEFEIIIGGQNMYPLFIDVNDDNLIVCSQDFFLVIRIDIHQDVNTIQQNTNSFLKSNVKLGTYNKVVLNQAPSCIYAAQNHIYLGMNDGKILCYDIGRKSLTGTCDDFYLPIMQIKAVQENQVIAIDCAGNVKFVQFSHKTFLDKIIKTLVSTRDISVPYKINKRQKLKKFFSTVINKKQETSTKNDQSKQDNPSKQAVIVGAQEFPNFYARIQLPDDHLQQLLIENVKIIAVIRKNKISIITCTQEFQFTQQQTILEGNINEVGMLEFGVGGFQNSNNTHLLLAFSLNNQLQYYKGIQVEESYEWLYISSTLFENRIVDGKFISNNLLIILTEKQVTICNVSQNPQKIHNFDMTKFSYIDFFIQQQGLHFDKKLIGKSILRTLNKKNQFFCLQGKRLLTGKIDSWKDYLQRYVDEQKFNQAMVMSLKIYNRQLKKLSGINEKQEIRNQEMKQFFQRIALTYVSYEIKKENLDKDQMLSLCIYYLVKTQCFQYLFTTIYQIIHSLGFEQKFLEVINEYVLKGQIKVITEEILQKMISWYKNRNQKDKLQIMVQNFDLTLMDKSILLIMCLKEHLYESMIYICNQHNDFISPILKLCGICFTQNLQPQDKQKIKQILFFYLKECLLGHNTEYGNSKAYIEMLIQVINFVFIPSTLDMLVGISCSDTIKIVNMFFQTKILQYILENEGQFFIKKNDYVEMKIFEESCINEFKVYQKMLSTLIFIMDQNQAKDNAHKDDLTNKKRLDSQSLFYQVNKFLSYLILKNQFPFSVQYKINSINFFIQTLPGQTSLQATNHSNYTEGSQQQSEQNYRFKKSQQEQKQAEVNAYFMRLMDSLLRSVESKQEEIQKTLNIILNKIQTSPNQTQLMQGKCYILNELGKSDQVLKLFLKMTNSNMKNKVFDYLEFNLNESTQLRSQFVNNLGVLFSLNRQKTHNLLNGMNPQFCDHDNIISNLSSYPDIQLQYIEQILLSQKNLAQNHKDIQLTESTKNKYALAHLAIVVKHKSSKLDEYIQKIDYPLEEAFKICQQKNNKTAKAYIMIKSGRNLEGLLMLCDIFLLTCDEVFGQIARKKLLQPQRKANLSEKLNKLLFTCQKQFEVDNERGQKIWQKCIKKIFKHLRISQNIRNEAIPPPIKQILREIVQKTMKKMFSQMSPEFFIDRFCKKFPQLPFSVFIIAFSQIFDRMEFYSKLQYLQLDSQQKDENREMHKLIKLALRSNAVWSYCQLCGEKLSSSEQAKWTVITHSCGCNFHKVCVQSNTHGKNSQEQKRKIQILGHVCMNEIQNFVERKGLKLEHFRTDHNHESEIKKRIVRLKDYETNQSCIFDLPSAFA